MPTSSIFPIHDYKAENTKKMFYGKLLELNFCNKDSKWINALKEYAFKVPEIKFNTNNIKNAIVIKTKGNSKGNFLILFAGLLFLNIYYLIGLFTQ